MKNKKLQLGPLRRKGNIVYYKVQGRYTAEDRVGQDTILGMIIGNDYDKRYDNINIILYDVQIVS